MQKQFDYIVNLAKEYHNYKEDSDALFLALNNLSANELEDIHKEYADPERSFQPVTLLRAEVARLLLEGKKVNQELVEVIKEKIRNKDKTYFSSYKENFVLEMENYGFAKRDIFANWQNAWTVFHCFFYRQTVKENVQNYLEQIAKDLLAKLNVKDYKFHAVDFQGSANFGSDFCWLGLYPITKESHKDAYQFFVEFKAKPQAGKMTGSDLKKPHKNNLKPISSYNEVVECLTELKNEIVKLNDKDRNYFKFAVKTNEEWKYYRQGYISMNYEFLGEELPNYDSLGEIMNDKSRFDEKTHNKRWNLWLFQTAKIGDIVFAARGVNTCLGIGIIESEILDKTKGMMFSNPNILHRNVKWITNEVYNHQNNTNTTRLFRNDSFSPTRKYKLILEEYIRKYPTLASTFEEYNLPIEIDIVEELNQTKYSEIKINTAEPTKNKKNKGARFLRFINPLLKALNNNGGEGKSSDIVNQVIQNMEIPLQELEKKLKSGQPKVKNNIAWARNYLREGGYLSSEKHGVWTLTDLGKNKQLTDKEILTLFKTVQAKYLKNKNQEVTAGQLQEEIKLENKNEAYNFSEDKDKPFISEEQFLQTVEILKRKKNIILQGAAGVGKTFIARKLAYQIMGQTNNLNIEMVQFHQSYSYEDFIQGLRPTKTGGFEVQNGVFYDFCKKALAHPERHFFFIIDEINRGNLSKIFGELMMLIEADKRDEKFSLKLTYSEEEEDRFYIPKNLYLIGTMNTADRSLAMVDYALRRRFAFVSLKPDFGENFKNFLSQKEISQTLINHISNSIQKVNQEIAKDINLGEGFQIGHSYFCDYEKDKMEEKEWFNQVIQFEIQPLLEEIWFDDSEKVREMMKILWIN
ncbi:AAA family ATPase [Bernardetia sp. Wsw4-3y2]|uniref:AAA family ATPase n=1 Tax=Bernardetia sp. Wsw4-3y2 TaxID=3127471 RepID=UPI0030D188E4